MSTSENREAAFIASVTAGTTHEIRNVLAIVKESAGLIEDLVRSFGRQGPQHEDKITRAVSRIDAQIGRGATLLSNLNRFAHSLDHARDEVDCDQEVQQVASLCQFRARRKRQTFRIEARDRSLTAFVSPFRLQMALFTAVDCCLEQLPEGSTVRITTDRRQDRPVVEFAGEEIGKTALPAPAEAADWKRLVDILGSFGASVEADDAAYGFRLILPAAGAS
jgi:C4-dicarboxylate-specific signal transduction histidine kinase